MRLNFRDDTKESCDDAGRKLEPGFYRALIDDVFIDQENGDTVFTFVIADGPFKGLKAWERIPDVDMLGAGKRYDFVMKRVKTLGARMGLVPADAFGTDKDVDIEFATLVGSTVIIEWVDDSYTKDDGTVKHKTCLAPFGMWPLDYPAEKFPKALRVALKITLPGETEPPTATAATGKKGGGNSSKAAVQQAAAAIGAGHDLSDL